MSIRAKAKLEGRRLNGTRLTSPSRLTQMPRHSTASDSRTLDLLAQSPWSASNTLRISRMVIHCWWKPRIGCWRPSRNRRRTPSLSFWVPLVSGSRLCWRKFANCLAPRPWTTKQSVCVRWNFRRRETSATLGAGFSTRTSTRTRRSSLRSIRGSD